ncbi:type VI secretion system TssO [uncultured Apibacter sp.]|uniref:type VI secretion system TssO n=1 Tax=uncultured Apibacter sp. TaxID=1778616 RepID=UPI0025EA7D96|nr:type VI secretion system TssO [uncultured Apibacter sp.]
MEILNKKDRWIAFLLFISLFTITIVVIVISIFFNYQLPWKENYELRKENAAMIYEFKYQEKFENQMEVLKKYIDSIDMPNNDIYYYQQKSIDMIIKMEQNMPGKDSIRRRLLYTNFLLTSRSLIDAKKTLKTYAKSKSEIDTLLAKVDAYKKQLQIVTRELQICSQIVTTKN